MPGKPKFDTLVDVLRFRAANTPDREVFFFAQDSGDLDTGATLTFGQLDAAARRIGGWLRAHLPGDGAGKPVVLSFPPGLDFAAAYFGCLYAGAVAVPAPLPEGRTQQERVAGIVRDCDAAALLTDSVDRLGELAASAGAPAWSTAAPDMPDTGWSPPVLDPRSLAMLQYTSGSTSAPKGVMLSHANVLANLDLIARRIRTTTETRMFGWLPFHHDMGLTQILSILYAGGWGGLMSPMAFLKRPHRWLRLLDRHRADICVAPNFAYELCTRRLTAEQLEGLDLSRWTAAMNGSEPISAAAVSAFAERFAPYGFRPEAMYPCYGMAEATLFISGGERFARPVHRHAVTEQLEANRLVPAPAGPHTRELVGSGQVVDYDLRIVEPGTGEPLADGLIGEIWVRGPSIGSGYWNRPVESAETFDARTADGEGGFLRTGDLGAVLDGELFVTGRRKEVLIVHGRNIYPQDIERQVQRLHPALADAVGAVFAVGDADTQVAVVHEARGSFEAAAAAQLAAAIRDDVSREFGIRVAAVALVRPGQIPRTTSGKVQRRRTRALFLAARLATLHEDVAPGVRPAETTTAPSPAATPAR